MKIDISSYNNIKTKRRKPLYYIAFIKFLSMIMIIKWHVIKWNKIEIDYGARMCEILFISSGFLVGYNYYKRQMPSTFHSSFNYAYKHVKPFYPLELINIFYSIYLNKKNKRNFNITDIEVLILNIFMIKSWSRFDKIVSCYDGISWFYSVLLFCYLLTPLLLNGINNIKNSIILFLLVSIIRIGTEIFIANGAINILDVNFHRGPIIRCMEFYLGMLSTPLYFKIKFYLDKFENEIYVKRIFTMIQILFPIFIYYLMIKYNQILYRCYFVLIFCLFIFIISFDYGYLSKLFSKNISKNIMSCQLEMYLLQNTLNSIMSDIMLINNWKYPSNSDLEFFIKLLVIFIISFIYKKLLKGPLSIIFDIFIFYLKKIFNSEINENWKIIK